MSIACQADRFLLDGKKEKFSCPIFLLESNLLLKKRQPMCMAAEHDIRAWVRIPPGQFFYFDSVADCCN
jgi:hypothetical protein